MNPDSARVVAWKRDNREKYNAYMRELRRRNPDIERRNNARKRAARVKKGEQREADEG